MTDAKACSRAIRTALVIATGLSALIVAPSAFPSECAASIDIAVDRASQQMPVVRYAAAELLKACQGAIGSTSCVEFDDSGPARGRIELIVAPGALGGSAPVSESYRITARADGSVTIAGADAAGVLWGVRDFVHYYVGDWITSLSGTPMTKDVSSAPALQNRGLWSWWHGCNDPYGYIDRASEWKLNTAILWNKGVPLDAEHLNTYAHERGVRIWWGFSWGWTAGDFADASPELAARLQVIYERQKAQIGSTLANLCPYDPETPQALMDYVLDVFENQYAWIPSIDGIYFQTATEAVCPCSRCQSSPRGEGFMRTMLPIIQELHRRYPNLLISCGVHNSSDIQAFKALEQIPDYCNICWEAGTTWAPSRTVAQDQMTYRGANENYAGVYRVTMNCGMVFRDEWVRGETPRVWLPRIDKLWDYLEEGQPQGSGTGGKLFVVDGKEVGYPCTSDWRAPSSSRLIDNPNFQELLTWSRDLAQGPAKTKGVFLLVEAGLMDLKMRRVPAMASEIIWNPTADQTEMERRCQLIWTRQVEGWSDPANPGWQSLWNAALVSDDIPTELNAGQAAQINITVRNSGSSAWTGPDVAAEAMFNSAITEQKMSVGEQVTVGSSRTFSLAIHAPSTAGVYTLRLRMRRAGSGYFGPYIVRQIGVGSVATAPTVSGYVRDSGGQPIPNAEVAVVAGSVFKTTSTDATGHYILTDMIPISSVTVQASMPGYDASYVTILLGNDSVTQDYTLAALPAGAIYDTFSRADVATLGQTEDASHITWVRGEPNVAIQNGRAFMPSPYFGGIGLQGVVATDVDVTLDCLVTDASVYAPGIMLRQHTGTPGAPVNWDIDCDSFNYCGHYMSDMIGANEGVSAYVGGVYSGPPLPLDWSRPHRFHVRIQGAKANAWLDGVHWMVDAATPTSAPGYVSILRRGGQMWVDNLVIRILDTPVASVAAAKALAPGSACYLQSAVVTGVFDGFFYIEDASRASGIKVVSTAAVHMGDNVAVSGTVGIDAYGEPNLTGIPMGLGNTSPIPALTMNGRACIADSGLPATGLLARLAGTASNVGAEGFCVNDGSPGPGVRVLVPGGVTLPSGLEGKAVIVTGCAAKAVGSVPALRMRAIDDLQVF